MHHQVPSAYRLAKGVVAPKTTNRRSVINGRTIRHTSHHVSQRRPKRVEEPVGWVKTIAGGRKLRYIGQDRNRAWFNMPTAVYNLIRITALYPSTPDPPVTKKVANKAIRTSQPGR